MEVFLGPGNFVFDGDPASYPQKKRQTAGCNEVNLGSGDIVLDGVAATPRRGTVVTTCLL